MLSWNYQKNGKKIGKEDRKIKRKTKKNRKINEKKRHSHNMKFIHNHKTKANDYTDNFLLLFN